MHEKWKNCLEKEVERKTSGKDFAFRNSDEDLLRIYLALSKIYAFGSEEEENLGNSEKSGFYAFRFGQYFSRSLSELKGFARESIYPYVDSKEEVPDNLRDRIIKYKGEIRDFLRDYDFELFDMIESEYDSNFADLDFDRRRAYFSLASIPESARHYQSILNRHLPSKPQDLKKKFE